MTILFITTRRWYVFFCKYTAQTLVWNWYGSMKDGLPFHSGIFHIPYRNFRSIPYHALVVDSISLLLLHFTPTVVASLKIRKSLISKKLLTLSAPFHNTFVFEFASASSLFHRSASASTSLVERLQQPTRSSCPGCMLTNYFPIKHISLHRGAGDEFLFYPFVFSDQVVIALQ